MYNRIIHSSKGRKELAGCLMLLLVLFIICILTCISGISNSNIKTKEVEVEPSESGCDITETDTLNFYIPVLVDPEI